MDQKIYTPTPATARRAQTIASKHSNEDVADILERLELAKAEAEKAAEARVRPSVPSALSEDEDRIVSAAFRDRLFKRSSATAEVHATSIERLRPGKWLNDEIINFYGGMLSKRSAEDKTGKLPKIFYCNTFFFVKMQGKYDKSFGRWTKKVNIFDLDLMIMPINDDGMHWVAAVMDMKAKRVEYYDSMGGTEEKANKAYNTIMRYFAAEHEAKLGTKFDAAPWTLQYLADTTPQQDNGVDCGVFTCQTLEMRSRGLELGAGKWVFGARNMPFLRRMMVYEIAEGKLYKRW
ncbi:uncharacterized protein MKK02DRAFT_20970 [Dioszegia hungarica]|uniref:Ubiquitin-like protease family profile domain-containing protein n=1 Tax=Dioszegia hungarica TaxID=4972 RepID=A0AA38H0K7_9TREE|nr:uncharacterized protein MKK02DRAFT_20970 [Dioszegia hungarica]KAI9632123.1 hypothetical protein MKK02DRAFT_20970 [Dioszegia hungarica]